MELLIKRIDLDGQKVPLPVYASEGAAAMDFHSANLDNVLIMPGATVAIPLGLKVAVPAGYKLTLKPRSGLALNHGITVLNTPGTVDSDYRGEVKVILHNTSDRPFLVEPFMRICQGELEPAPQYPVRETNNLDETVRGDSGFNSTGLEALTR